MKEKDVLVTLAGKNFINQSKQLFVSVFKNSSWTGDYLLLAHEIPDSDLVWFKERGVLIFKCKSINTEFEMRNSNQIYPNVTLSKFYLFKKYFKKWRKVVFLDSDIIVNFSLKPLLRFKGMAAPNSFSLQMKDQFIFSELNGFDFEKKYPSDSKVFCSGVMILDTELINDKIFDEIINLHRKYFHFTKLGEEAILNLFFYKNWHKISHVYNFIPEREGLINGVRFIAPIIHFACCKKPWEKSSPYFNEWMDNLKSAENINFKKHLKFERRWTKLKMFKLRFMVFLAEIAYFFDRKIGQLGILLKKYLPFFYKKFRKIFYGR